MTEPNEAEKEIHVDEDWKSRVQAEKETAANKEADADAGPEPSTAETTSPADEAASRPDSADSAGAEMPPASFSMLINSYAMQAMVALGVIPDPEGGKVEAQPAVAKVLIDLLGVLEEKTKGNLTADEEQMLRELLHQLRMMYVSVTTASTG